MSDYTAARTNMVDCQIHTAGIPDGPILEAFQSVPREQYVPEKLRNVAYLDEDLEYGDGRFLLAPAVHARMIEAVALRPDDVALDIGGAAGYSAAILSSMVSTVIALQDKEKNLSAAQKLWQDYELCNIAGVSGALNKGWPKNAPYELIFINGAVAEIPEAIIRQLSKKGRLIAIVQPAGARVGRATLVKAGENGHFSTYPMFEASCPYVPGFEPAPSFAF